MDKIRKLDVEEVSELLEQHNFKRLKEGLESMHPVDIVDALDELDKKQRTLVFRLLAKEEAAEFYRKEEEERHFLKGYEEYDYRQMRKMTHLERIRDKLLLFDYRNRNPLNGDAGVYEVQ